MDIEKLMRVAELPPDYWTSDIRFPHALFSASGQVYSLKSWRLLKGGMRGNYVSVTCCLNGPYLHHVICEIFHGPRPTPRHQVRHLDGNIHNNSAFNLAWGTAIENAADKKRHGTDSAGERNGMAKLSRQAVDAMRQRYAESRLSFKRLGAEFGVSTMTAFRAVRGQSWK